MLFLGILAVLLVLSVAYIRLAPSDPKRWHVDPATAPDPGVGGVVRRVPIEGDDALGRFDAAALSEPSVTRLAGSPDEGLVTYLARSKVVGFPDYITVSQDGGELVILSRLRFGRSDLGVNAARLTRILKRM